MVLAVRYPFSYRETTLALSWVTLDPVGAAADVDMHGFISRKCCRTQMGGRRGPGGTALNSPVREMAAEGRNILADDPQTRGWFSVERYVRCIAARGGCILLLK